MVRVSVRHLICICLTLVVFLCILYSHQRCDSTPASHTNIASSESDLSQASSVSDYISENRLETFNCYLNREVAKNIGVKWPQKKIDCRKEGKQVFLPFSFLEKHYETRGAMVGDNEFEISQSYSKVYSSREKHQAKGPFMHFENFKVEVRSRVLCVSAATGVPVSRQWDPAGYYYPTQIAQYSLAHYGNHLKHRKPSRTVLDNGDDILLELTNAKRTHDNELESKVIEFNGQEQFTINVRPEQTILCLDFKNFHQGRITVEVEIFDEPGSVVEIHYNSGVDQHLEVSGDRIVFGLGSSEQYTWVRLTRDVANDVDRVRSLHKPDYRLKSRVRVRRLRLSGHGQVKDVWLSDSEHYRQFLHGADWFVGTQDKSGGWPSMVVFNRGRKKYPGAQEVKVGWHGAMCQGQAISVLVRAYLATGLAKYLEAAIKATALFTKSTKEGGVKSEVLGHIWYEEYPLHPPSHILNGFLYGLLGLYELSTLPEGRESAHSLYRKGLDSLLTLLPLYDSGSGTFYDLRHLTMFTAPKGARWDYHATHINQLLTLASIEDEDVENKLRDTAERWKGYMVGQRAPHN